jgi:hypothetical protein
VAEHSTDSGHWNKFQETEVLAKTSGYMDQLVKDVREVRLHPNNIYKEEGFKLSKAWNPTPDYEGTPTYKGQTEQCKGC